MIPTTSANAAPPTISGKLLFHVIVDDFHRTFSIDGPGGPNGVRLHYEMLQAARAEKKKLRDFDLRADSHEAALAEMQNHFPAYQFLGTWPRSLRDFCTVRSVFSEKKKLSIATLSRTCRGSLLTPGEPWRVRISHQKRERTA